MKFYSQEIFTALHSVKKPYPFTIDVVEDDSQLILRVYANDIMKFTESQRKVIMEYLLELRQIVLNYKVPCIIQGSKGDPV